MGSQHSACSAYAAATANPRPAKGVLLPAARRCPGSCLPKQHLRRRRRNTDSDVGTGTAPSSPASSNDRSSTPWTRPTSGCGAAAATNAAAAAAYTGRRPRWCSCCPLRHPVTLLRLWRAANSCISVFSHQDRRMRKGASGSTAARGRAASGRCCGARVDAAALGAYGGRTPIPTSTG